MWFYNDPENGGLHYCETDSEAQLGAEKALDAAKEVAAEYGWEDNVQQICWGFVRAAVQETSRTPAPEASDFTELVQCELVPCEE